MSLTEVTLTGGERLRVEGEVESVLSAVVSAARGSIMEFAWVTDADTAQRVAVNPDQVVTLRGVDAERR